MLIILTFVIAWLDIISFTYIFTLMQQQKARLFLLYKGNNVE